jgi:hypothetical protein
MKRFEVRGEENCGYIAATKKYSDFGTCETVRNLTELMEGWYGGSFRQTTWLKLWAFWRG